VSASGIANAGAVNIAKGVNAYDKRRPGRLFWVVQDSCCAAFYATYDFDGNVVQLRCRYHRAHRRYRASEV
jgi:hypothetical protein